jgi:hypothetical protein
MSQFKSVSLKQIALTIEGAHEDDRGRLVAEALIELEPRLERAQANNQKGKAERTRKAIDQLTAQGAVDHTQCFAMQTSRKPKPKAKAKTNTQAQMMRMTKADLVAALMLAGDLS